MRVGEREQRDKNKKKQKKDEEKAITKRIYGGFLLAGRPILCFFAI
jgi:hypothetical protein